MSSETGDFLQSKLVPELTHLSGRRQEIESLIEEYIQLKTVLESTVNLQTPLSTRMDIGCGFFVNAQIESTEKVFVAVGLGFFAQFTRREALTFLEKKLPLLRLRESRLIEEIARLKVFVEEVSEFLLKLEISSAGHNESAGCT